MGYLLEAIVFPSASIARYHEVVNVVTKSGKVVSGLLVKETVDRMFLSSAEGVVQPHRPAGAVPGRGQQRFGLDAYRRRSRRAAGRDLRLDQSRVYAAAGQAGGHRPYRATVSTLF